MAALAGAKSSVLGLLHRHPLEIRMRHHVLVLLSVALVTGLAAGEGDAPAPAPKKSLGYSDTPIIPNQKWHVHDGERPQPRVVTPGTASTQELPGKPPSDAIVLFDGTSTDKWSGKWKIENGAMIAGGGDNTTKDEFGDMQLHLEWSAPEPAKGSSQGRANSGLFLMGRYELQILDCFENQTYPDGQAAAIYGQWPPLVNACRPPGQWQTYDVVWVGPRFDAAGKFEAPATITVMHNGVFVHNRLTLNGPTPHRAVAAYQAHPPKGPLKLQDHGNPVRFRNIWVRPLKGYDE